MNVKELSKYQNKYQRVPVTLEFEDRAFDPLTITQTFHEANTPCFLLTGKPKQTEEGYTFLGLDPTETITYRDGLLTTSRQNGMTETKRTPIQPYLEKLLNDYQTPKLSEMPPFTGGLAGYFSYDYSRYATTAKMPRVADPLELNDVDLLLIEKSIAFNHTTKKVTVTKLVAPADLEAKYDSVLSELMAIKAKILKATQRQPLPPFSMSSLQLQFSEAEFTHKVAATKKHIVDGDIFQLILSNPQQAKMKGSLFSVAPTLFHDSPSPYQFYFQHGDFETVGASPETLITKRDQTLFTYPLAGTRRRGKDKAEDDAFARELQNSPKELSEHNMLIDLGRNDLGSVSKFGSVRVTAYRRLLKFSNVMHLGSVVESTVAPGISPITIIDSVLPAGTLSGAPKVSAMQIIGKLENRKRGVYGGCVGYLGFDGDLDLCIGIRLAYRKKDTLVVHSGAGIVADSVAKYEYQEFNNKAKGVTDALNKVVAKGDHQHAYTH